MVSVNRKPRHGTPGFCRHAYLRVPGRCGDTLHGTGASSGARCEVSLAASMGLSRVSSVDGGLRKTHAKGV